MDRVLINLNPTVKIVGFDQFTLEIFNKDDVVERQRLRDYRFTNPYNNVCREKINEDYFDERFESADTVMVIHKKDFAYFDREHEYPIDGFIFLEYAKDEAYISLLCSRERSRFGPMLLCCAEIYLNNIGVKYIYLDGATAESINFFVRSDYVFSSQPCGYYDEVEQAYYYQGRPPNFVAPQGQNGVRMKKCNIPTESLCVRAVQILR